MLMVEVEIVNPVWSATYQHLVKLKAIRAYNLIMAPLDSDPRDTAPGDRHIKDTGLQYCF